MTVKGDRVELVQHRDHCSTLASGTRGTVGVVDALGTMHVRWDDGSTLGLIPGVDSWKTLGVRRCSLCNQDFPFDCFPKGDDECVECLDHAEESWGF